MTNRELTTQLLSIFGFGEDRIRWVEDRLGHDRRYSVDWNKINRELGYTPQNSLKSALPQLVEWYQSNPQWWRPLKKK